MARVYSQTDAKRLNLPGRISWEILCGATGARAVSLRLVEIPVPQPGDPPRGAHVHLNFEECIFVMSGEGEIRAGATVHALKPGDTILIPAGEPHVTHNSGAEPLMLLCFFPVPDVAAGTREVNESGTWTTP